MNNVSKKIYYFFFSTIFTAMSSIDCRIYCTHIEILGSDGKSYGSSSDYSNLWLNYDSKTNSINYTNNHNNYGIRSDSEGTNNYYRNGFKDGNGNPGKGTNLSSKEDEYFQDAYNNFAVENEILNYHACYTSEKFLAYARTLPHYNQHILDLQKKIEKGEEFIVPGFKQSSFFGKKKNEFHDFIKNEAKKIKDAQAKADKIKNEKTKKQQETPRLNSVNTQDFDLFSQYCKQLNEDNYNSENNAHISRINARIKAINQTRKDAGRCCDYSSQVKHIKFNDPCADVFNNCYGTALDKQLHQELCQARVEILDLQKNNADNIHVKAFCPIILLSTAHAKIEKNAIKAFNLSDFSHDLVRIVSGGICLLKRGALRTEKALGRALNTSLDWQHWKDMGLGIINLFAKISEEFDRKECWDNKFAYGLLTGNYEPYFKQSEKYEQYYRVVGQAVQDEILSELAKVKKMPWGDLYENGIYIGFVSIFDGIIINFSTIVATDAGRKFIGQISNLINSPVAIEFAVEAAGIGKITLEEGADIANMAMKSIEGNPELLSQGKLGAQVMEDMANYSKQWVKLKIGDLKNTHNFKPGALEHILEGEINARGKAVGFHYEGMPMSKGKIINGTETPINQFGVYTAKVEVSGIPKVSNEGFSSFFPKDWDAQKIVNSINEAFENKKFVEGSKNTYIGKVSNGVKIQMFIDKTSNKIISAFPVK